LSWLADYLEYTQAQESPEIFHFWVGLSTMASVLGRRVELERRDQGVTYYKIYPGSLMVILVAPAGKARKSTALRIGEQFMKHAKVRILSGKGSTENILRRIAGAGISISGTKISQHPPDAVVTIVASELSNFLSKQVYAETLVDFLLEAYDAGDLFEFMVQNNPVRLVNPCVTLVAAATPISIGQSISERAHSAGFLSRVLPIYCSHTDKEVNPLLDVDDSEIDNQRVAYMHALRERLQEGLSDMKKLQGPFSYTPAARAWLREWSKRWDMEACNKTEGYATRRMDHMLRVAMILRVSEFMDLVIDERQCIAADTALSIIESSFHLAFSHVGQSNMALNLDRVVAVITQAGGRATSEFIYNRVHRYFLSITEMRLAMETLRASGVVLYHGQANNTGSEVWSLKQKEGD